MIRIPFLLAPADPTRAVVDRRCPETNKNNSPSLYAFGGEQTPCQRGAVTEDSAFRLAAKKRRTETDQSIRGDFRDGPTLVNSSEPLAPPD